MDLFEELPQHVKDSIEAGLKDIKEGNIFEHEQVIQEIYSRYGLQSQAEITNKNS
jgi:predicted transcriptional regulator